MLIKVNSGSRLSGVKRYKSRFWEESGYTPNTAYDQIEKYRRVASDFGRYNRIPGPFKFVEARVISANTSLVYTATVKWWDHPKIMDMIFWVYMKPVTDRIEGAPYQYYCLEPNESFRAWELLGKPGQVDLSHAFMIPVECVDLAWNETVNGVSEHLHTDLLEPEVKTQAQLDREEALNAEARKLLADGWSITPINNEFEAPRIITDLRRGK